MDETDREPPKAYRKTAIEVVLAYENKFFAVILGLLAVQLWVQFFNVAEFIFYFEWYELISLPFFSMGVTVLSALYLTVVAIILMLPSRPFQQYKTFLPNGTAIFAGFGVYLISLLPVGGASEMGLKVGIGFLLAGVVIVLFALAYLGRAFSVTPHASILVTSGPYTLVRHPMYIGNILTMIGLALIFGNMWAYMFCTVFSVLQIIRALYEEGLMERTIPDYKLYKERVGGFFPKIAFRRHSLTVFLALLICIIAGPASADWEKQCREWSKIARLGQWYTAADAKRFETTGSDELSSGPACKAFMELQEQCQDIWFITAAPEEALSEEQHAKFGNDPKKVEKWAEKVVMQRLAKKTQCLSILGSVECERVKNFARKNKGRMKSGHKRLLKQCLHPKAGSSGLLRAAL